MENIFSDLFILCYKSDLEYGSRSDIPYFSEVQLLLLVLCGGFFWLR